MKEPGQGEHSQKTLDDRWHIEGDSRAERDGSSTSNAFKHMRIVVHLLDFAYEVFRFKHLELQIDLVL